MRRASPFLLLALAACGGEDLPPLKPPPPPTAEPVATVSAPADTEAHLVKPPPVKSKNELRTATLKAAVDGMNAHDGAKVAAAYAPDAVLVAYGQGGESRGRDAIARAHASVFAGFGDAKVAIARMWQSDDAWAIEWALVATQTGTFMGLPAKGAKVGEVGLSVVWFDHAGLISGEHRYFDSLTLRDQIAKAAGARPPPALPSSPETHAAGLGVTYPDDVAATSKLVDAIDGRDAGAAAALQALLGDDPTLDDFALQTASAHGKSAYKDYAALLARAMPDGKHVPRTALAADDYVVAEFDWSGTLRGGLPGVPAAPGAKKDLHGAAVLQWSHGKLAAAWIYGNRRELLGK